MQSNRPSNASLRTFLKYLVAIGCALIVGILVGGAVTRSGCKVEDKGVKTRSEISTFDTTVHEPVDMVPQKGGRGGGGGGGGGKSDAGRVTVGDPLALVLGAGLMAAVAGEL